MKTVTVVAVSRILDVYMGSENITDIILWYMGKGLWEYNLPTPLHDNYYIGEYNSFDDFMEQKVVDRYHSTGRRMYVQKV